jgi:hypothetical protein
LLFPIATDRNLYCSGPLLCDVLVLELAEVLEVGEVVELCAVAVWDAALAPPPIRFEELTEDVLSMA